jgi:hypothetical protein
MEAALITTIGDLILKYGIPAALQILKEWEVTDPTLEDIMALRNRVPKPETFFEKPEDQI